MSEKQLTFGKIFWPSLLAVFIMSIIGIFLFALILGGIIGSFGEFGPKPLAVRNNSVLHVTLKGEIKERADMSIDPMNFELTNSLGLSDILYGIETAQKDSKIKGIFLEVGDLNCGYATAKEIRAKIKEFQNSGKFVVAYNAGELITQKEYYLSSVAKENYAFPSSAMEFLGLGTELTFFKGALEKLDVEVQVIRGNNNDFKSAVEPFFRDKMSDSSRVQINRYLTSMWEDLREDISKSTKIPADTLNLVAENMRIKRAQDGLDINFFKDVKFRDEVLEIIAKKVGLDNTEDLTLLDFQKYTKKKFNQNQLLTKNDKPNIAVILAEGEITTDGDELSSQEICKLIRDARKNKSVKTIVLRINSPGGSALASEEIWREVYLTNKLKKVIVSMGDVAASGGYYIAAPATTIFAEPTTITGSIGVFGMIPYTGKMFEDKLGITFDRASTNSHSVMSTNRKLTAEEMAMIQNEVDSTYAQFLTRVSDGRKMTREEVNQVGRGRVWTGRDAKDIGLVDRIGGLSEAITHAAKLADIKEPKVLYYPLKKDDKFFELLEELSEDEDNAKFVKAHSGLPTAFISHYEHLKRISCMSRIQMRMSFDVEIH